MKQKWQQIIISLLLSVTGFGQNMVMNNCYQMMPQIGVLVENVDGTANKVDVIKNVLGSRYARMSAFQAQGWAGPSTNIPAYTLVRDEGMGSHFVLDVGFCSTFPFPACEPEPWITASTAFNLNDLATAVDEILTKYPLIRVLVLDNEEINRADAYHEAGRVFQYMNIAAVLLPICRAHGVKLANGGFGQFEAINGFTFRYIKAAYGQATANAFAMFAFDNGISGVDYQAANDPNCVSSGCSTRHVRIAEVDTVVKWNGWDLLNFHIYNPIDNTGGSTPPVNDAQIDMWRYYTEAFRYGNGVRGADTTRERPSICNETGQRGTEAAALVTNMLEMFWRLQLYIVDWWSGTGQALDARPLTTDAGVIQANGQAYETFSDRYDGRPPATYAP